MGTFVIVIATMMQTRSNRPPTLSESQSRFEVFERNIVNDKFATLLFLIPQHHIPSTKWLSLHLSHARHKHSCEVLSFVFAIRHKGVFLYAYCQTH
jgi:hypothetical protein